MSTRPTPYRTTVASATARGRGGPAWLFALAIGLVVGIDGNIAAAQTASEGHADAAGKCPVMHDGNDAMQHKGTGGRTN
jgi:hypothetical protein